MSKMKTLAVAAVSVFAICAMATASHACDAKKAETAKAETASATCAKGATAETADAKVAGSCAKGATAETAEAKVAGACAKGAKAETASATKVAGAACTKGASATTAGTKVAGGSCNVSPETNGVKIETVRMPSGTLAVFYHGVNDETRSFLQAKAASDGANFGCPLASKLASAENCKVDAAQTSTGMMILVHSDDADTVDALEESYKVAMAEMASQEEGE